MDRADLIASLAAQGITDGRVLTAMATVPRERFVKPRYRSRAWEDHPLPIGAGQTISQPFVVAAMTQALELQAGDRILDVGTGCGYQAAVLAELGCQVFGVELVPELAAHARQTLHELGYSVDVLTGDGRAGRPELAPFDAIVVAAASNDIPDPLLKQLRPPAPGVRGGRMIIPVAGERGQQLELVARTDTGYTHRDLFGVRFVPLL